MNYTETDQDFQGIWLKFRIAIEGFLDNSTDHIRAYDSALEVYILYKHGILKSL